MCATSLVAYQHNLEDWLQVCDRILYNILLNVLFSPLVLNVSLISSLQGVPFSMNVGGLTIYRCSETTR